MGRFSVQKPSAPDDYQAQADADTLMRAEEVKGDKGRHEAAQTHVRKKFHTAARAMAPKGKKAKGKKSGANPFTASAKLASAP